MRGQPLRQWLLFILLWGLLALPIVWVTRDRDDAGVSAAASHQTNRVACWVSLRFSAPPASFRVLQEHNAIWSEMSPEGVRFERELELEHDAYGAELRLSAALPREHVAVEVTLEPFGRQRQSRTLWSDGDLEVTLSFPWRHDD